MDPGIAISLKIENGEFKSSRQEPGLSCAVSSGNTTSDQLMLESRDKLRFEFQLPRRSGLSRTSEFWQFRSIALNFRDLWCAILGSAGTRRRMRLERSAPFDGNIGTQIY
jgi:hypothetical protein